MSNLGLVPLVNFGEIVPNLYRSAQPQYKYQYNWLIHTLEVQRIINLRAESDMDDRWIWTLDGGFSGYPTTIQPITIAVPDHKPPTIEQARSYMAWLRNDGGNLEGIDTKTLIHCQHGHGRTSTFSVLSKIALGMSMEDAIKDERDRFHYEFKHAEQLNWLEQNERKLVEGFER